MSDTPRKGNRKFQRMLGAGLIVAAFALVLVHLQENLSQGRMERDGEITEARVVRIVSGQLPDGTEGHAAVVSFTAEGAPYRVMERVSDGFVARHGAGDTLRIRYWRADPRLTELEYEANRSWRDYALYLAGLSALCGLLLTVLRFRR
ncbi:DUF3592 domain-containing protein [Oceanibium sediminis]|uniref:DUF3592 domain-containing protein n=1 Tax=Oceanibium sediminis TaxID=2026339 RepID=UPI000DD35C9F|nr:DUF3592 domain-containing protein [Oceanibium sediminis]